MKANNNKFQYIKFNRNVLLKDEREKRPGDVKAESYAKLLGVYFEFLYLYRPIVSKSQKTTVLYTVHSHWLTFSPFSCTLFRYIYLLV